MPCFKKISIKGWLAGITAIVGFMLVVACQKPDEEPPTVEITNLADGDTVSGFVTVIVEAVDEDSVESVTLLIDDVETETLTIPPYTFEWNTLELADSSTHIIQATSLDPAGNEGQSDPVTVYIDHGRELPAVPELDGPSSGFINQPLTFTATTTDPNNDSVSFQFDWGDGSDLELTDLIPSGGSVDVEKTYDSVGTYQVRVKAIDVGGAYSDYSSPKSVVILEEPKYGSIQINSTPGDADIILDGDSTGLTTNVLIDSLTPGDHSLALRLTGYTDWDSTVTVLAEDTVTVDVALEEIGVLLWRFPTSGAIYSSPAIDDEGIIYVGSDDHTLYAVNPADGTQKWNNTADLQIISSPTVDGGKVYYGSADGNLYAVDQEGGFERWTYPVGSDIPTSPSIGSDGMIYFGVSDNNLYKIDATGTFVWKFLAEDKVGSSAAIDEDGTIYFGSDDGSVYAVTPQSSQKWKHETGGAVKSSPAIASDGTVYVGSQDGYLYALDPDNGSRKWRFGTQDAIRASSPAIGPDGTVYIGSIDNYLYAVDPSSGTEKWSFETGLWITSSPAVGADGTVYFGSLDSCLYAVRSTGELKWCYKTGGLIGSSPAIADDGTVYVGCTDGYLYAIKGDSYGLASSAWPKFAHDNLNSGRAGN